ncbi:MAG: S9 family peptidase [Ignavibacteria bacterium]|jgi:dipeptidyl aminopeptidase/acylaminoacyl peptidase
MVSERARKKIFVHINKYFSILSIILAFTSGTIYSQGVSLDYIFQDTNIVNPRPSLKSVSTISHKIYYYADDDYNGSLSLFDYDYLSGVTFKYSDTADTPSEFTILENGDAMSIIRGDIYISKNFTATRYFSKDVQITNTDAYEYSPMVRDNYLIYRRAGNYFMTMLDPVSKPELQLTKDESDSISYQIMAISGEFGTSPGEGIRLLFARYDNTPKKELIFPDYTGDFVRIEREKRGTSQVKLLEYDIHPIRKGNDTLTIISSVIRYPDSTRLFTQYTSYSPDSKTLVLDAENAGRNTRKLFSYDIITKSVKEIYSESYDGWFERHGNATRFIDSARFIFESEVSGYNGLYTLNSDGTGLNKIAGGNYTILESVIDGKNKQVYYIANTDNPAEYGIYKTDLSGKNTPEKLTALKGDYQDMVISRDGNYLFYEHSYIDKPNELYCLDISGGKEIQATNTISPKFTSIDWTIPEQISFTNQEDGQQVYAFLYKPENFSTKKKYPLICFVHGSGYLQEVTEGYSTYGDNFMVNTYLVQNGYLVLDVDYRGSAGYGRDFRNKTYHNLGYWEVSDYMSGIDYLDKLGLINREKVGIYGGSYGGFITLMAAFRHPEYFKAAAAMRAVSDWKSYVQGNLWFTLARLGELNDDSRQYYESSSPITYAEELQIPLLIIHGMMDDNVFFLEAVHLVQKLIDLKKDFEVMIYPKENHNFYIQADWLDQYKRIFKFFDKNLKTSP